MNIFSYAGEQRIVIIITRVCSLIFVLTIVYIERI